MNIKFRNARERRDVAHVLIDRAEQLMGDDDELQALADLLSRVAEDIWPHPFRNEEPLCPACGETGGEYREQLYAEYQGAEGHGATVDDLVIGCSKCIKSRKERGQ